MRRGQGDRNWHCLNNHFEAILFLGVILILIGRKQADNGNPVYSSMRIGSVEPAVIIMTNETQTMYHIPDNKDGSSALGAKFRGGRQKPKAVDDGILSIGLLLGLELFSLQALFSGGHNLREMRAFSKWTIWLTFEAHWRADWKAVHREALLDGSTQAFIKSVINDAKVFNSVPRSTALPV